MEEMDVFRGFEMEKEYFSNHVEYRRSIYQSRTGMKNLTADLNKILVSSISEMLPSVMTEIIALEAKINKKLEMMGEDLPETKEGKVSVLNRYVSNFNSRFLDSIESRGTNFNTGKQIKDIFVNYREGVRKIKPFMDEPSYSMEYFKNVVSSFEGNHMSFHIPPVQVLEACMMDESLRPIMKIKEPSMRCVDEICDSLIQLIRDITKQEEYSQYPPLASHILTIIVDEIISKLKIQTKKKVNEILLSEEAYIWTDDEKFAEVLAKSSNSSQPGFDEETYILTNNQQMSQKSKPSNSDVDFDNIKIMLESYYSAVKDVITHNVPKIIMKNVVREIEMSLLAYLIQNIVNEDKIELLKENEDIEKQRKYYCSMRSKILAVKKSFSANMK